MLLERYMLCKIGFGNFLGTLVSQLCGSSLYAQRKLESAHMWTCCLTIFRKVLV